MSKFDKICIVGGGSLGLVCAGVFLSHGLQVNILSGHPSNWSNKIKVFAPNGRYYEGELNKVTSITEDAVSECDIVLLTVPGFLIEKMLNEIKPYLNKSTIVGSIVSSTGFFFFAHDILDKEQCLFGFQRVPFIARQRKYGEIGELLGYKSELNVAIENCANMDELLKELEIHFETPVKLLNNFYEASLTNSNPILHTGRLYSMWKEFRGEPYAQQSLFYSDWTDEASELLIKMDNEFQQLLKVLGIGDGVIPPLLEYYESIDASSLTKKVTSIEAFKTIKSPMKKVENGWIPDFNSRYFIEDFPFGLRFIRELAQSNNIPTPIIDEVFDWGISKITESGR